MEKRIQHNSNPLSDSEAQLLLARFQKSYWKEEKRYPWHYYCPLCGVSRWLKGAPKPTARHFFQVLLTSLVITLATWPWWNGKGWVSFIPLWVGFEVIYRWRVRGALACGDCGFDPYLYVRDVKRARQEVQNFWRKRQEAKEAPKTAETDSSPSLESVP